MKKAILSLVLILLSFPAFSAKEKETSDTPKFPKGKGAILIEDLKEGKVHGSLEKMTDKKKAAAMRLIGHSSFDVPKDQMLVGNKFVLIGWLGVQKIKDPSKVVMFKEPIVSSFIIKDDRDAKGITLPTFGEIQYVMDAIKNLEEDKIDLEDLKKKRRIKIPTGKGAEILLPLRKAHKKDKPYTKKSESLEDAKSDTTSEYNNGNSQESDSPYSENTKDRKSSQSRSVFNPNSATDYNNTLPALQNLNAGDNLAANALNERNHSAERMNNPTEIRLAENQNFDLHLLPEIDEEHLPSIRGNAVVLVRNPSGHQAVYYVRNGEFVRGNQGRLIKREVNVNVDGLPNGRVERNAENRDRVDQIIRDALNAEREQRIPVNADPEVTVELTEDGCPPLHDALQEKVTIMSKARKFEDGRLVHEGNCERTLETYNVRRDYLCENCQDEVDLENKRSYARYMEFWIDRNHQRHDLGIKLDRGNPFAFFEKKEGCGFDTETENGFAIKMSKLGYLNKFGVFKMVEDCRVTAASRRFQVQETANGCDPVHDFVNGVSHEQKRSIFTINRVEHEARACHPIEPAIPHEFVEMGCRPILDLNNHTITSTARRRIRTSMGLKLITDECEPRNTTHLQVTRNGCENEYFHDLTAQRSYLKKRYFILKEHNSIKYVTGCIRTNDFIPQQTMHNGEWEHDDENKISHPLLSLYIEAEQGRMTLEPPRVRGEIGAVPYTLERSENRTTGEFYFEGCFRRTRTNLTHIYRRGDNSIYEHIVGPGNIIASTQDECTKRIEKSQERGAENHPCGFYVYVWSERIISVNPQGTVISGPWMQKSRQVRLQESNNGESNSHSTRD